MPEEMGYHGCSMAHYNVSTNLSDIIIVRDGWKEVNKYTLIVSYIV